MSRTRSALMAERSAGAVMTILYSDNRILICLKPPGVVSTDEPGGMPSCIRAALGDETACVRTVHRLDAAVGGVMVFARSKMAAELLSQQMRERRFGKEYLAVAEGVPETAEDTLRDWLFYDRTARMARVMSGPGPDVREAVLDYRVLGAADGLSLLWIRLHTGRTHQIRVQLASRGMPLAGDRKYGAREADFPIALWSYRLQFFHPQTGLPVVFTHLPPETAPWQKFSTILQAFEGESYGKDKGT